MVKPPIVWGTLSFREEGRPGQKKKKVNSLLNSLWMFINRLLMYYLMKLKIR